jgi:hypothetical protein
MEQHPPMMGHQHMHGISTTHSDHDKYSMVLACFIVVMVFLIIIIVLLGMSARRQGSMLNNSNNAMAQMNSLKKAIVTGKGAQRLGMQMPQRKGGFSNGLMGANGAHNVGGYIKDISPMNWGSDGASRLAQTAQGGMSNITGQGLKGTISGDCATGSCNVYDDLMTYSTGGGGMPLPTASANSEVQQDLNFFKSLGTIAEDVNVAKTNAQAQRTNMQTQRANAQAQRANAQAQRANMQRRM